MPGTPASHTPKTGKYSKLLHHRAVIQLLLLGMLLYIVAMGIGGLRLSLDAIRSANPMVLVPAILAVILSYVCATLTYILLATKRLLFFPTLMVQISGGLVNRLLPGGLGGLGINTFYLKKRGHALPEAVTIVAANNTLGFIGNVLLILIMSLLFPIALPSLPSVNIAWEVYVVAGLLVLALLLYLQRHHGAIRAIGRSAGQMWRYLQMAARRPGRALLALLSSCLLTALHAVAMYAVLQSLGSSLPWHVSLLAISSGALAGAAIPTPGGLGGAEAGIVAVLAAFGMPAGTAVAAALVYRGITYWLPLLPGYLALRVVERNYL